MQTSHKRNVAKQGFVFRHLTNDEFLKCFETKKYVDNIMFFEDDIFDFSTAIIRHKEFLGLPLLEEDKDASFYLFPAPHRPCSKVKSIEGRLHWYDNDRNVWIPI